MTGPLSYLKSKQDRESVRDLRLVEMASKAQTDARFALSGPDYPQVPILKTVGAV